MVKYMSKNRSNIILKIILFTVMIFTISGCSEYPSDGVVDTQYLREKADIISIEGSVYGIEKGSSEKVALYYKDVNNISPYSKESYLKNLYNSIVKETSPPVLKFEYPKVDGMPSMVNFESKLVDFMSVHINSIKKDVDLEIENSKQELKEDELKMDSVKERMAFLENATVEIKKSIILQEKEINESVEAHNLLVNNYFNKLNALLTGSGFKGYSGALNPFLRYGVIDYTEKEKPSACPIEIFKFGFDLLSENNSCVYIMISSRTHQYEKIYDDFSDLYKEGFLKIKSSAERIGNKSGWRTAATGLWAEYDDTLNSLKVTNFESEEKFGSLREINNEMMRMTYSIQEKERNLEKVSSDSYLTMKIGNLGLGEMSFPEDLTDMIDGYKKAVKNDLNSMIYVVTDLKYNDKEENATFEGLKGDFEGYAVVATILAESNGRRQALGVINVGSLIDSGIGDLSEIKVKLKENNFLEKYQVKEDPIERITRILDSNPIIKK